MIEGMRGGCYCNLSPARMRCGAASSLDEGDEMATTVQDIIAGVEVLTTIPEWFGDGGGETKMTVRVGESGAMSIMNVLDAAGFVIVSKEALKAGSDGYG